MSHSDALKKRSCSSNITNHENYESITNAVELARRDDSRIIFIDCPSIAIRPFTRLQSRGYRILNRELLYGDDDRRASSIRGESTPVQLLNTILNLSGRMDCTEARIDRRLDRIEDRMDRIETRIERIKAVLTGIVEQLEGLEQLNRNAIGY